MTVVAAPVLKRHVQRTTGTAVRIEDLSKRFTVRRSMSETLRRPFDWKYASALQDVTCEVHEG